MPIDSSDHPFDANKSLFQLKKKQSDVRSQLAAKEQQCGDLSHEIGKRIPHKMSESEHLLRIASSAAKLGVFEWDVASDTVFWENDRMYEIFGRTREEGPISFAEFFSMVLDPQDRPKIDRDLSEAMLADETFQAECRIRRCNDGQQRWVEFSGRFYPAADGSVQRIVGVAADITERKKTIETLRASEERYRSLVETASEGIWQIDAEFRTVEVNERMAQMLGCRREELIGRHIEEFMAPEELADVKRRMENRRRGLSEIYERLLLRKDGSTLWSLVSVTPQLDHEGNVVGSFGMFTDISDRKRAEENLRKLNETLEQQVVERTVLSEVRARQLQALAVELTESEERERQRIAQLLHDDLQQLLVAARMQLETACEGLPSVPMLANVGRLLEESIGKMRRLSHELRPSVLHHSGLIPALKWLSGQLKDNFGLQVLLEPGPVLEPDSVRQFENSPLKAFLFRAVQELLFNVIKHAGVKSARVALSAADNHLEITVSDQGLGFNPNIMDSYDKTTGFGLISIRERARFLGGNLVIESRPKQGSRFTLTVPVRLAAAEELRRRATDR